MNQNIVGLDIGTGSVKVATVNGVFSFPSVVARGKDMSFEAEQRVLVGEEAVDVEKVKSMVLRTPVYRGVPTSIDDYMELVRHALNKVIDAQKDALSKPYDHTKHVIVAGLPYNAGKFSEKIKKEVSDKIRPKFFGLMYQAKATLDNENISEGIVCHIGHGTTEIMLVSKGHVAEGKTILHGVSDITNAITTSKTGYLNRDIFSKNSPALAEQRQILAGHISDALEKIAYGNPGIPVICAGGGALIPKLVPEIKNEIITSIRIAENPVFSNALGMLKKAAGYVSD